MIFVGFLFLSLLRLSVSDESARLVASKTIVNEQLAQNMDMTVVYSVFNVGDG